MHLNHRKSPRPMAVGAMALLLLASTVADAQISVRDATVTEGNSGTSSLNFPIEISTPLARAVDIEVTSLDGLTDPATAGSDYAPLVSRVRLPAGARSTVARVSIFGDVLPELDETLRLRIGKAFEVRPPNFSTPRDFPAGSLASSSDLVIADFDGDGKPDIAATSFNDHFVAVLRNTSAADGVEFAAQITFGTGRAPRNLAAGDIDGDGKVDLVVVNQFDANISVLRNTSTRGTVSFAAAVQFPVNGVDVALADVDGDGALDVGIANGRLPGISLLRNISTLGSIAFDTRIDIVTSGEPMALAFGDLDGDGRTDLVAPRHYNLVGVFRNTSISGRIAFAPETTFDGYDQPHRIAVRDMDGDGRADLVTSSRYYNYAVHRNESTASGPIRFALQGFSDIHSASDALGVEDLDGDGRPDVLIPEENGMSVNPGTSTGSGSIAFGPRRRYPVDGFFGEVATADFDGDGIKDVALAASRGYVSVLPGSSRPGEIVLPQRYDIDFGNTVPVAVVSEDFDGNGTPDLAFSDRFGSNVLLAFNASVPGSMEFGQRCDVPIDEGAVSIASGDFDGDGKPDLAIPNARNDVITVLANRQPAGSSCSWPRLDLGVSDTPLSLVVGDLDGDGRQDLVSSEYGGSSLSVLLNRSSGGSIAFAARQALPQANPPRVAELADFDADGRPDIVLSNYNSTSLTVLRNTTLTPGTFRTAPASSPSVGVDPASLAVADFDGDGMIDVAVSVFDDLILLRNSSEAGEIHFDSPIRLSPGQFPGGLEASDVDRDGDSDLIGTNAAADFFYVFENVSTPGNPAFLPPVRFALPGDGGRMAAADLDGDGVLDLAFPGGSNGKGHVVRGLAVSVAITRRDATGTIVDDDRDSSPEPFDLTDQSGVPVGTVRVSNTVTVRGINFATAISVTGGEYSKNGGSFTAAAGSVIAGDTLTLRHVASVQYSTRTETIVSVGSFSETFASTTEARDATPDDFGFAAQAGAPVGSVRESNVVTITGINGPASISITGGEYRINDGPYRSSPGAIDPDGRLQIRHTASPNFSTSTRTTIVVGTVSRDFVSTTEPADSTPDAAALSFEARRNVARNTLVESGTAVISGINAPASVVVSGGEYRINGGSYRSSAGTAINGDMIQVRHTSAGQYSTRRDTTVMVGGVSASFSSYTETTPDTQPDSFSFAVVRSASPGALVESETEVISGLSAPAAISISGGEYRINSGAYGSASGSISNGDRVSVRTTAPAESGASRVATLTIGGVTGTFTVTAQASADPESGGGGGGLGSSLLCLFGVFGLLRKSRGKGR